MNKTEKIEVEGIRGTTLKKLEEMEIEKNKEKSTKKIKNHELAKFWNIKLRIDSKELFLVLLNISALKKISK